MHTHNHESTHSHSELDETRSAGQHLAWKGVLILLCLGLFLLAMWASTRERGDGEHCAKQEPARVVCSESLPAPVSQFPAKGGLAMIAASVPNHRAE